MTDDVVVYIHESDPASNQVIQYLTDRKVPFVTKDVQKDPGATAVLFGRLGTVSVPTVIAGSRILVGFDPIQLAKMFPAIDARDNMPPSFGAAIRDVTAETAKKAKLPAPFGVELGTVKADGVAASRGLVPGDIITAIGPYTITAGVRQFEQALSLRRPGDTMQLTYWRKGGSYTCSVTFPKENPPTAPMDAHAPS